MKILEGFQRLYRFAERKCLLRQEEADQSKREREERGERGESEGRGGGGGEYTRGIKRSIECGAKQYAGELSQAEHYAICTVPV